MSSPFVMVIFGATGDLTGRKLMPALFKMYSEGLLPARNASRSEAGGGEDFYIVAVARRGLGTEGFVEMIRERMESPKNSRRSLEAAPGCSLTYERWTKACLEGGIIFFKEF